MKATYDSFLLISFLDILRLLLTVSLIWNTTKNKKLKLKLVQKAEEEFTNIGKKLADFKKNEFSRPITRVVSMLPKDGLAMTAEALVSLTSLKHKMSMKEETVGGPIDVAVISKGDGFVWMKRKHYFPRELNQQFLANYFREKTHEKKSNKKRKRNI